MKVFLFSIWIVLCDAGSFLRKVWLNVFTFGAWSRLAELCMQQMDDLAMLNEQQAIDRAATERQEYRLDELIRLIEMNTAIVIPGSIDAPRQTTFGAGIPIEIEGRTVEEQLAVLRKAKDEAGPNATTPEPLGTSSPPPK